MCTSPRDAILDRNGQITFSKYKMNYDKTQKPFKVPCGKCAECLLERARDWSVRCVHEAKMHEKNSFITLTYSEDNLPKDGKLNHKHFQNFMKKLRKKNKNISFFMAGEYGSLTLRPHYHACIFGYDPKDKELWSENKHGDKLYTSKELDKLWGYNDPELCPNKIGEVTRQSANYVARYVLKKQDKDFPQGYQRCSNRPAIGLRWLEKYWKDIFIAGKGCVTLSDGTLCKIPRYYEKWFAQNYPEEYEKYLQGYKKQNSERLQQKAEFEHDIYIQERIRRQHLGKDNREFKTPLARKREILKQYQKDIKRSYL